MDKENGNKADNATTKMPNTTDSLLDTASLFGAYWTREEKDAINAASGNSAANSAATSNLFAAAAAAGVYHPLMGPMGILPPALAAAAAAAVASTTSSSTMAGNSNGAQVSSGQRGANSSGAYLASSSTASVTAVPSSTSSAALYNNAYTNTLSAAASQAASLQGMSAWWSMAQQFAAHDYVARMQANALNMPAGFMGNHAALSDPYALGLSTASVGVSGVPHRGGSGKGSGSKGRNSGKNHYTANKLQHQQQLQLEQLQMSNSAKHHSSGGGNSSWRKRERDRDKYSNLANIDHKKISSKELDLMAAYGVNLKDTFSSKTARDTSVSNSRTSSIEKNIYSNASIEKSIYSNNFPLSLSGSLLEKELAVAHHQLQQVAQHGLYGYGKYDKQEERSQPNSIAAMTVTAPSTATTAIVSYSSANTSVTPSLSNSILSDPHTILGGVRLPPDTEIIKYTSSIVGPKIPGTTNRGRKKTISLDHGSSGPSLSSLMHPKQHQSHQQHATLTTGLTSAARAVSADADRNISPAAHEQPVAAHAASGGGSSLSYIHSNMLMDTRNTKRPKLDFMDVDQNSLCNDHVDVIKLPARNGSPCVTSTYNYSESNVSATSEAPLNLSLKPPSSNANHTSSSLSSLSNMSANIGLDRISRRKPGPKPRRVPPTTPPPPLAIGPIPSNLPPGVPSASLAQLFATAAGSDDSLPSRSPSRCELDFSIAASMSAGKDTRPRNLGRGVSKPKKNTVASLLAQSRALGIKPVPILDPNTSMSQQMSLLKSNILAAQQYIAEVGGDEKTLNKFLQDKFRGTLSDSSTVDASTDSDNFTDSNQTDSELESDMHSLKRSKQYDERALRIPLEKGWKRETIIRGITKNGAIRGDVIYIAPESSNKFKQMSDITQYLDYQKSKELTKENFTFSCRVILGDYIHMMAPEYGNEGEFIQISEEDVLKRLDELKTSMRTNIPVEQRIEVARRQQAARAAARLGREQARLTREIERSERQEAARKDKESKTQQMIEAKKKKQEEMERHKQEEQQRKQQERELKRQQNAIMKEQMYIQEVNKQRELLYTVELERERRRQHMTLVKALENRRKLEDRERIKQQVLAEKQANKEKKIEERRCEVNILNELRKPCEDLELEQKPLPEFDRIPGLKLPGKAFGDILMVYEFLYNFGETLGFDMESLPTLDSLQQSILAEEGGNDAEEELLSVLTHLIVCAIEDPGIPNPARHTTLLGQSLRAADITHTNLSEILRIYLYANATGEVKTLTGVSFERDREKRVADHHQTDIEMQSTQVGKNSTYYDQLHANPTWQMADMLREKPFMSLSATNKAAILSFICNELLQNKAVIRQIDNSMETVAITRKEKWILDAKARKLKMLFNKKTRTEAIEKVIHTKSDSTIDEIGSIGSPSLHKDDLLDDDDTEMNMSENESVGTQPEEEEDAKLSAEELGRKLEKAIKNVEDKLNSINAINHQMRATCYGQDRYFRRYWSLPKAGGLFIEAMESAEPSELILQFQEEQLRALDVRTLDEIDSIIADADEVDINADNEVNEIIGNLDTIESQPFKKEVKEEYIENDELNTTLKTLENGEVDQKLCDLQENTNEAVKKIEKCESDIETEATNGLDLPKSEIVNSFDNAKFNDEEIERDLEEANNLYLFDKLSNYLENEMSKDSVNGQLKVKLETQILNDKKTESSADSETTEYNEHENKWFSVLNREGTCDGVQLCSENKWDNAVGICIRDSVTELRIPVFTPSGSYSNYTTNTCDSPAPLQITPEEMTQMEYIKTHGLPKPVERELVPLDKRYGWWRLLHIDTLKELLANLHVRGARERELKRTIITIMQSMYEQQNKLYIEPGNAESTALCGYNLISMNQARTLTTGSEAIDLDDKRKNGEKLFADYQLPSHIRTVPGLINVPKPDLHDGWFPHVARRLDMAILEQVEILEDKVANASMQMKGWKLPSKDAPEKPDVPLVQIVKDRISSLEAAIERRYLKPPLGVILSDPNLAVMAQEAAAAAAASISVPSCNSMSTSNSTVNTILSCATTGQSNFASSEQQVHAAYSLSSFPTNSAPILRSASPQHHMHVELTPGGGNLFCATPVLPSSSSSLNSSMSALAHLDEVPKALTIWRDGVNRAQTSAQLAMCLHTLETSIAWDKSIMKANCQFCNSGDNEDKLLLCDSCDKGYHTYCFKPKIDNIPEGDWYCHECMNKAKGEKNCIVCGKKTSNTSTKLIACELCPRAYHTDCIRPNMSKAPRGKWYCSNCTSKKPHKKVSKKSCSKRDAANDSTELQAPASPTLSHSSATTNEDISVTPQQSSSSTPFHRSLSPLGLPIITTDNVLHNNSFIPATINIGTPTVVTTSPKNPTMCTYYTQQNLQGKSPLSNNSDISTSSVGTSPQSSIVCATPVLPSIDSVPEILQTSISSAISCDETSYYLNTTRNTSDTSSTSNTSLTPKKDKVVKKMLKELAPCKAILEDLECHDDAWPFLLPVNTKQFPTYKKIIKSPMDLSTIKKRLLDGTYKTKEEFGMDVRQIFNNCETFNEDDSPVGKAGHCMRQYFESRWNKHFFFATHS